MRGRGTGTSRPGLNRRQLLTGTAAACTLASVPHRASSSAARGLAGELWRLDGLGQASLVRSGEITVVELVRAAIERIERLNPVLHAVVAWEPEQALDRAAVLDSTGHTGAFSGLPFLIKDLTETRDLPTQYGSRLYRDHQPEADHPLVGAFTDAGVVVLGKTATPEFGLISTTEPLLSCPTRNPWSLDHSPGGSSGGTGAAVASGMVPIASGDDGGGSIRIPASQCGLFGLKVSMGVPVGSAQALPGGLAVSGVLSRTVRDSAAMLGVFARAGRRPRVLEPLDRSLKIGLIVDDHFGRPPHSDVAAAVEKSARLLTDLGHRVEPTTFAFDGEALMHHFMTFWTREPRQLREEARARGLDPESVLEPWTLGLAEMGDARSAEDEEAAIRYLTALANDPALMGEFDVLLSPVLSGPPVRIGEHAPILPFDALYDAVVGYVSYTPVANLTGAPAMSVPLYWNEAELPIGSQFIAPLGQDSLLLGLALQLEAARPWADRWPPHSMAGMAG